MIEEAIKNNSKSTHTQNKRRGAASKKGNVAPIRTAKILAKQRDKDYPEVVKQNTVKEAEEGKPKYSQVDAKNDTIAALTSTFGDLVRFEDNIYRYIKEQNTWEVLNEEKTRYFCQWFLSSKMEFRERVTASTIKSISEMLRADLKYQRMTQPKKVNTFTSKDNKEGLYLPVANGILKLDVVADHKRDTGKWLSEDKALIPYSPEFFNIHKLPMTYNPRSKKNAFEDYLKTSYPECESKRRALRQWLGAHFTTDPLADPVFMFLLGEGGNGKTVYLSALQYLIGSDNYCSIEPKEFDSEQTRVGLDGKLANISDDIDSKAFPSILKKIISNQDITGKTVYEPVKSFRPIAKHTFTGNKLPTVGDRSQGTQRRFVFIKVTTTVAKEHQVKGMDQREWWDKEGEGEGLLLSAIYGYSDLKKNSMKLTIPESSNRELQEELDDQRTEKAFIENHTEILDTKHEDTNKYIEKEDLYEEYTSYCGRVRKKPIGNKEFTKTLKKSGALEGTKRKGTKSTVRVWTNISMIKERSKASFSERQTSQENAEEIRMLKHQMEDMQKMLNKLTKVPF